MDEGLSRVRGRVGGLIKKASTGTTAIFSLKRIKIFTIFYVFDLENLVEPDGIEPTTSSMPLKRSPN